ncbi:MAG: acyl carrier protein [Candidatus Omnitrophota bacterium]
MEIAKQDMEKEVTGIISLISEIDVAKITGAVDLRDNLGIDSMMGLEIMYAVEKKFNVHLREEDLPKMRTVHSICGLVREKLT